MLEYQKAEDHLRVRVIASTDVVFGSARVRESERWYEAARQFARLASEKGARWLRSAASTGAERANSDDE